MMGIVAAIMLVFALALSATPSFGDDEWKSRVERVARIIALSALVLLTLGLA